MARQALDASAAYLERAIDVDDLGNYGPLGQAALGRSERLKALVIVRWLRNGHWEMDRFRAACNLAERWNESVFSKSGWEGSGFALHDWMADQIVLGEFSRAAQIAKTYYRPPPSSGHTEPAILPAESVFALVAASLLAPTDLPTRRRAEAALDVFYGIACDFGPASRRKGVSYERKLLYAYIRGRFFKNVEDPIRLVRMMKFGE